MMNDEFQKLAVKVSDALTDKSLGVGARVTWDFWGFVAGNMPCNGPTLSPVYVDEFARIWKEHHTQAVHELVCIADLRPPVMTVPADCAHLDYSERPGAVVWLSA